MAEAAQNNLTSAANDSLATRWARGLAALLLGLTQGFGLYLVSSNLPAIQGSLGATAAEASWLTTGYFATALSSTILLTKARLQFGLRPFANFGLIAFLAVSAAHLTTDSISSAVAARVALGFAAAPVSTLCVLYMVSAFPTRLAPVGLLLGFASMQLALPLSRVLAPGLLEIGQWHGLFLLEVAFALVSLAAIRAVPLASAPLQKAFSKEDLVAAPLYCAGLALLCVVVSQGRLYWWTDAAWLGRLLAAAIALMGAYAAVDLLRTRPLVDLRWLFQPYMLRFTVAVFLFRIALSEQTVGIVGLMTVLGQSNEQMRTLFGWAAVGVIVGFGAAIAVAKTGKINLLSLISLALIFTASCLDARATSITRPENMYLSQTLLSCGLAMFFAAACLLGFGPVVRDGSRNLVTFLAAFSFAQYMGSLAGSALISTVVARRQQWHFDALAQHLSSTDPVVALRLAQLAGSVSKFVGDPEVRLLQGLTLFSQQVTRESFVLAYADAFQYISALAALMFCWLGFVTLRAKRRLRLSPRTN